METEGDVSQGLISPGRLGETGETHCFVGPVVLHEDILSSVLPSISKQHDYFIAVCSGDTCLLKNKTVKHENGATDRIRSLNQCAVYIQQLVEGKMESRLVVSGAFSLHLLHCVFEDLFVSYVCLD